MSEAIVYVTSVEGHTFVVEHSLGDILLRSGYVEATPEEADAALARTLGSADGTEYIASVLRGSQRSKTPPIPNRKLQQPYPIVCPPEGYRWLEVYGHVLGMDANRKAIYGDWKKRLWYSIWLLVPDDIVEFCQGHFIKDGEGVYNGKRILL